MLPRAPDTPAKVKAKDDWFREVKELTSAASMLRSSENAKKLAHNVH